MGLLHVMSGTLLAPNSACPVGNLAKIDGAIICRGNVTFGSNATLLFGPIFNRYTVKYPPAKAEAVGTYASSKAALWLQREGKTPCPPSVSSSIRSASMDSCGLDDSQLLPRTADSEREPDCPVRSKNSTGTPATRKCGSGHSLLQVRS
jgi:hypothetical protein